MNKPIRQLATLASILAAAGLFAASDRLPAYGPQAHPDASMDAGQRVPEATSLPDTSVFLIGSGLALLIALLAWGEQIRSITRDTRDLERDFLQTTGLTRAELSALLQAKSDDDRLVAFTNIMASGKLTSASQVEILPLFERWRALGTELRSLQSKKYWLTIVLTVVFLGTGTVAALAPSLLVSIVLLLALPAILVILLLVTIVSAGRVEQRLNALLMQIAETV